MDLCLTGFKAKTSIDQFVQSKVKIETSLMQGVYQVTLACAGEVVAATFHCGRLLRREKALCGFFPSKYAGGEGVLFLKCFIISTTSKCLEVVVSKLREKTKPQGGKKYQQLLRPQIFVTL